MKPTRNLNIAVYEERMPGSINGVSVEKVPGEYMIFIRSDMTAEEKESAFAHEMLHIWHDDFSNGESGSLVEKIRHGLA